MSVSFLNETAIPRRAKLTDDFVKRLPFAGQPGSPPGLSQYIVRDSEAPGFFLVVGKRSKTYTAAADATIDGCRQSSRETFGRAGDPDVTAAGARRAAKDWITGVQAKSRMREPQQSKCITLAEAFKEHRRRCVTRGRQPATLYHYDRTMAGALGSLANKTLDAISSDLPALVRWFTSVSESKGEATANGARALLSASWNSARRLDPKLPPNPIIALDKHAYRESPRGMSLDDISGWAAQLREVENPVRRELHLMTLLTGSRPDALTKARWEHVDTRRRVLHIPEPKGGAKKAFDVPLSRAMIRSLVRVRRAGLFLFGKCEWIFPADSSSGHIQNWTEDRATLSQWGRDLRKTFRTIAAELEVPELFSMALMNHSTSGVHNRYIAKGKLSRALREAQEGISRAIAERVGPMPTITEQVQERRQALRDGWGKDRRCGRPGIVEGIVDKVVRQEHLRALIARQPEAQGELRV
jgi:integrase